MENLGCREKASSSNKEALTTSVRKRMWFCCEVVLINNIVGHPHKGWNLRVPSCSFTGEQSNFTGQETLDDLYQVRVGVSFKKYIILKKEKWGYGKSNV